MIDFLCGDAREVLALLPAGCCSICVTSPPYRVRLILGHSNRFDDRLEFRRFQFCLARAPPGIVVRATR